MQICGLECFGCHDSQKEVIGCCTGGESEKSIVKQTSEGIHPSFEMSPDPKLSVATQKGLIYPSFLKYFALYNEVILSELWCVYTARDQV